MKKIYTFCLAACLGLGAYAQSTSERIVLHEKSGNFQGYLPERVDSISFPHVEGEISAEVKVLSVSYDHLVINVTRSENCRAFKFANIPTVMANRLTDDAAMADYVNQSGGEFYYNDFESGKLTDASIQPNTEYVLATVGYDEYKTPCKVNRVTYTTAKKPLVGNPKVDATLYEVKPRSFTYDFSPNGDVGGFAVVSGVKGEMQTQYEQWGPMMGFKNFGDLVKAWGVKDKSSFTWKDLEPNTEYEVFVQAWDKENTYADCDTLSVTTKKLGDSGKAGVTVTLGNYEMTQWEQEILPSQFITYTPNSSTACYRFSVMLESEFNEDPEGWKEQLPQDPPFPMKDWFFYEEVTTDYQINPNVKYVVLTAARNADGVWSEVKEEHFTTPQKTIDEMSAFSAQPQTKVKIRDIQPKTFYINPGQAPVFSNPVSTQKATLK